MPPPTAPFLLTAEISHHNPEAFYAYRERLIEQTIADCGGTLSLHNLQSQIDQLRSIQLNPQRNVRSLANMLNQKLADLSLLLGDLQSTLDLGLPEESQQVAAANLQIEQLHAALGALSQGLSRLQAPAAPTLASNPERAD